MLRGGSKLVVGGGLVVYSDAIFLQSDKADGGASDDDFDVAEFDNIQLVEEGGSVVVEQDNESVVQHPYFSTEDITNAANKKPVEDIPDDLSDATTTAPVVKPLPSGHIIQVSRQIPDDAQSVFTRASHYDKKDPKFTEQQFYGEGVNELFVACKSGDAGVVKRLLENPSSQNGINKMMTEQDYYANELRFGIDEFLTNETCIRRFGIGLERIVHWDKSFTPLMVACVNNHIGVIQELLACEKLDVNQMSSRGVTALVLACLENRYEVVRVLLGHATIDINMGDTTPLMIAIVEQHTDIVRLLLCRADINVNKQFSIDRQHASSIEHSARKETYISQDGHTALHTACNTAHLPSVCLLLAQGGFPKVCKVVAHYICKTQRWTVGMNDANQLVAKDGESAHEFPIAYQDGEYEFVRGPWQMKYDEHPKYTKFKSKVSSNIFLEDGTPPETLTWIAQNGHQYAEDIIMGREKEIIPDPLVWSKFDEDTNNIGRSDLDMNIKDARGKTPFMIAKTIAKQTQADKTEYGVNTRWLCSTIVQVLKDNGVKEPPRCLIC